MKEERNLIYSTNKQLLKEKKVRANIFAFGYISFEFIILLGHDQLKNKHYLHSNIQKILNLKTFFDTV